ncbi:hypothetical protein Q428_01345 [Fervidicella metallireducens AeB]|uniref:Prepilin-type N-terminal cleavage/methylation domain-containing protein n=1 Tax=Fervidicella metallireducens AeB TaxID=1403537 RepID=A0A017RYQ9_9CLOT|nr:prepilin-type N-terminal cleavage/methylation domain-containing protein [Fervidicella metallireducens]EYE89726.1 hypothetical protein Q428_01345 [Fervidicella metallireducens AeB]
MKNWQKYKYVVERKKGLTMVELLISLALIGVIILLVSSIYIFGVKIFDKGTTQSNIQVETTQAGDFITKELRNAVEITFNTPVNIREYSMIYLDKNIIKYKPEGKTLEESVNKTDAIILDSNDLSFQTRNKNSMAFLNFTIKGTGKQQSYLLNSEVLLNNIKSIENSSSYNFIYYKVIKD